MINSNLGVLYRFRVGVWRAQVPSAKRPLRNAAAETFQTKASSSSFRNWHCKAKQQPKGGKELGTYVPS